MILTKKELKTFLDEQKKVFEIVRLVDVSMMKEYSLTEDCKLISKPYQCYAIWNKNQRCENCISAKAYVLKGKLSKFEFIGNEVYFVVSIYSIIDDEEYMIEMVTKLNDETLFGTYGKDNFIESIEEYNRKLYIDPLTGAYNRLYYNEQLLGLNRYNCVAMVDIDNFKEVNSTFGHFVGDAVLKSVVDIMINKTRNYDAVIRIGGDEFLILFQEIDEDTFTLILNDIKQAIFNLKLIEYPTLKTSISIGGVYSKDIIEDIAILADRTLYEAKKEKNTVKIITY